MKNEKGACAHTHTPSSEEASSIAIVARKKTKLFIIQIFTIVVRKLGKLLEMHVGFCACAGVHSDVCVCVAVTKMLIF